MPCYTYKWTTIPMYDVKKKKSFKLRFNLVIQEIKAYIIHVFLMMVSIF